MVEIGGLARRDVFTDAAVTTLTRHGNVSFYFIPVAFGLV